MRRACEAIESGVDAGAGEQCAGCLTHRLRGGRVRERVAGVGGTLHVLRCGVHRGADTMVRADDLERPLLLGGGQRGAEQTRQLIGRGVVLGEGSRR